MKRFIAAAVVLTLVLTACMGCSGRESTGSETIKTPDSIRTAVLKGPTAIGMVNLMAASDAGEASLPYSFTIAGTADEITADLIRGDIQIAAIPANLASVLYNKTGGGIGVAAVNNYGVLYIVELADEINSVSDLKGRTIYSTGKGTTPEYTLRYLLTMAGIDPDKDVTIEYKSEATEVAAVMASAEGDNIIAMLPQPYVTVVTTQNENARVALDVTEEWNRLAGDESTVVTGVIAINRAFAEEYPEAVREFLKEFKASADAAVSDVDGTAALVGSYDIFKEAVARKAVPKCGITYTDGADMKSDVSAYLEVLFGQNPASIGGALPGDDFYLDFTVR